MSRTTNEQITMDGALYKALQKCLDTLDNARPQVPEAQIIIGLANQIDTLIRTQLLVNESKPKKKWYKR